MKSKTKKKTKERVKIVEVGARDGLQNEHKELTVEQKSDLIARLAAAGLENIEIGAFVSPKWVPQMSQSPEVIKEVFARQKAGAIPKTTKFSALVPNPRGMQDAVGSPLKEVAVFGACTESFSQKNINCTIDESFARFKEVTALARKHKIKVRGYLSMAFGCPYEGKVPHERVIDLVGRMFKMGIYEVSIGDTIGVATPQQVIELVTKLKKRFKLSQIAMHFHDTRGTALANVFAAYQLGVRVFDSSVGGLGGCPYAQGASGNLATEDLVYLLNGLGVNSKIDINQLIIIKGWLEAILGHSLPSRVGQAGMPKKAVF